MFPHFIYHYWSQVKESILGEFHEKRRQASASYHSLNFYSDNILKVAIPVLIIVKEIVQSLKNGWLCRSWEWYVLWSFGIIEMIRNWVYHIEYHIQWKAQHLKIHRVCGFILQKHVASELFLNLLGIWWNFKRNLSQVAMRELFLTIFHLYKNLLHSLKH